MFLQQHNYGFSAPVVFRMGLACEARLAVNPDKLTEPTIILWEEH